MRKFKLAAVVLAVLGMVGDAAVAGCGGGSCGRSGRGGPFSGWFHRRAAYAYTEHATFRSSPGYSAYTIRATYAAPPAPPQQRVLTQPVYWAPAGARPPAATPVEPGLTPQALSPQAAAFDPADLFVARLNQVRAQCGLRGLGCDRGLCGWAAANNAQQQYLGMGHHVMGPSCGQCAAMSGSYDAALGQWLSSPPHRAILLNPSATMVGVSVAGTYATANTR